MNAQIIQINRRGWRLRRPIDLSQIYFYYYIKNAVFTSNPKNYTDLIVRYKGGGPAGSALNKDWCLVPAYNEAKETKIKNLEYYVTCAWRYP